MWLNHLSGGLLAIAKHHGFPLQTKYTYVTQSSVYRKTSWVPFVNLHLAHSRLLCHLIVSHFLQIVNARCRSSCGQESADANQSCSWGGACSEGKIKLTLPNGLSSYINPLFKGNAGFIPQELEKWSNRERHLSLAKNNYFYWFYFLKWAIFIFVFRSVFGTTVQILQQINVKNDPSSIRCRDSNSRPLNLESPPITIWPGLPPIYWCAIRSDMGHTDQCLRM